MPLAILTNTRMPNSRPFRRETNSYRRQATTSLPEDGHARTLIRLCHNLTQSICPQVHDALKRIRSRLLPRRVRRKSLSSTSGPGIDVSRQRHRPNHRPGGLSS